MAYALPGARNVTLFTASLRLGRYTAAGLLPEERIAAELRAAAWRHHGVEGFTAAEADRAIANGLRYGHPSAVRGPTTGAQHGQRRTSPPFQPSSSIGGHHAPQQAAMRSHLVGRDPSSIHRRPDGADVDSARGPVMDPDTALAQLRAAIGEYRYAGSVAAADAAADRIAEYAEALDTWLSAGGFLPADWDVRRR